MLFAASRKTHEQLKQRLSKLKARPHPRNSLKKLPGYGRIWFYYKGNDKPSDQPKLNVEIVDIAAFVKKLRTRPPPEEREEDYGEKVEGPGFEYPNERDSAKCVKHWAKRFKQWHPPEALTTTAAAPKRVIRFKPVMPQNEVDHDGKRYKRVESSEEIEAMLSRGVPLMQKREAALQDARFYGDILKEDDLNVQCQFVTKEGDIPTDGAEVKELLSGCGVAEIHAPFPVASKMVTRMKKRLAADGQGELAAGLRVELANREADPEEVNTSDLRRQGTQTSGLTLDEGDAGSVYM